MKIKVIVIDVTTVLVRFPWGGGVPLICEDIEVMGLVGGDLVAALVGGGGRLRRGIYVALL